MKSKLVLLLLTLTSALTSTVVFAHLEFTGKTITTQVSGKSGTTRIIGPDNGNFRAIYAIHSMERGDKPCRISSTAYHLNLNNNSQFEANLCGSGGSTSGSIAVYTSIAATGGFISGIKVCLNNDRTRLKGFKINTRKIDRKADLVDYGSGHTSYRTNCKHWQNEVNCPAEHLATAVIAHYTAGSPSIIKGLALRCRKVNKTH